jgi:hypothetical protein
VNGLFVAALLGWPFTLLLAVVVVAVAVKCAERTRRIAYLEGRLKAYRGTGRSEYEANRAFDTRKATL